MNPFELGGAILLLIASIIIILVIMMQESKQQGGLGAIDGGASDSFVSRNGAKTKEAFFAKMTKILAIIFFVVSFGINLIVHFVK